MTAEVLVLNANYEPLNICTMHRAIGLILTNRANLIANGRGEIHTAHTTYPLPSVIRLQQMVIRPRRTVRLTRREIFRRDNYTCQYCGKHTLNMTVDHVYPRHLGGQQIWINVVTACSSCNHRKGGRTLAEADMHLMRPAKEPPATAQYIFGHFTEDNTEWVPYLVGW
jgi:5-methylcytosine-specific restriction endonuclease McrA